MKLSIEAKVAAAVAVAFAVLSMGAIAREQSERGTAASSSGAALSQVSLAESIISSSESRVGTGKDEVLGLY
jgi:hypothetical protein